MLLQQQGNNGKKQNKTTLICRHWPTGCTEPQLRLVRGDVASPQRLAKDTTFSNSKGSENWSQLLRDHSIPRTIFRCLDPRFLDAYLAVVVLETEDNSPIPPPIKSSLISIFSFSFLFIPFHWVGVVPNSKLFCHLRACKPDSHLVGISNDILLYSQL